MALKDETKIGRGVSDPAVPEPTKGPFILGLKSTGGQRFRLTLGGGKNAESDLVHLYAEIGTLPDGLDMLQLTESVVRLALTHNLVEVEARSAAPSILTKEDKIS